MKKQLVKHLLHSTAALAVCAVMLMGIPLEVSIPSGISNVKKPGVIVEVPDEEDGETAETPGIVPLSDRPVDVNLLD